MSQTNKLSEMYIKNHHDAFKELCSISLIIVTDCLITIILIFRTICTFDSYTFVILQDQTFNHLLSSCNTVLWMFDRKKSIRMKINALNLAIEIYFMQQHKSK